MHEAAKESEEIRDAVEFFETFQPQAGKSYDRALNRAREAYKELRETFKNLDDKAAWLVSTTASGSWLLSLAAVFAVSNSSIHPLVALATIPAIWFASLAMIKSASVRKPKITYPTPDGVDIAEQIPFRDPEQAEAYTLCQWAMVLGCLKASIGEKAKLLDQATGKFTWAIRLLILPVVVSALIKLFP